MKPCFYFLILILIWSNCARSPDSILVLASPPQEIPSKPTDATKFRVDTETSKISWIGTKPTGQHNGTIAISDGIMYLKDGLPVGGNFTMDMNDIQVDNLDGKQKTKLTNHLLSSDFFDVENHPVSTFVLTDLQPFKSPANGAETTAGPYLIADPTHVATGNFSMRGTNLSITFPVKIQLTEQWIEAAARFNIDRTKWGVSYWDESTIESRAKDKLIYNVVHVAFTVKAIR